MRWVTRNLSSLLISLILAIAIWVAAINRENPIVSQPFLNVPLQVGPLPPGMVIVNNIPHTISVTIRGPQETLQHLSADKIPARVDLAGAPPGASSFRVQVTAPGPTMYIETVEPSTITVDLETMRQTRLPIHITTAGQPGRGFTLNGSEHLSTDQATIQGPVSIMERVQAITGQISIAEARGPITQSVPIQPVDATGQVVSGVIMTPTVVTVTVPIVQREGFVDLPVRIQWRGQPASGYRISNIEVKPNSVLLTGPPAVLARLPRYIETSPVDINNADTNLIRRVDLNLPAGVSSVDDSTVYVEVSIETIESSFPISLPLAVKNLDPGLWASPSVEKISVSVFGPLPVLESIKPGDIEVYVDASELHQPGVFSLTPKTSTQLSNVEVKDLSPGTVQVVMGTGPSPTPFVFATPTPTPKPKK